MHPQASDGYVFELSGGRLCLDFANTLSGSRARSTEHLNTFQDLLSWGRQSEALDEQTAQRLGQAARRRPRDAVDTLAHAVRFREALFRIFDTSLNLRAPDPADLDRLNAVLAKVLVHQRVVKTPDGFAWAWERDVDALDRMLWPVARSAADLLASDDLRRVRKCAGANCDWLFMDTSRNRTRRWCDMKSCGNRAKAHRYYERHRARADAVERRASTPR